MVVEKVSLSKQVFFIIVRTQPNEIKSMGYTEEELAKDLENQEYKFGFTSNFESDKAPNGYLNIV